MYNSICNCNPTRIDQKQFFCHVVSALTVGTLRKSPSLSDPSTKKLTHKYLHLLIANTLGLEIVSSSCRPQSRAGVSLASSPCAWLLVLWLGSQESQRNSMEKFCSPKPIIAKRDGAETSTNYRRRLQDTKLAYTRLSYWPMTLFNFVFTKK